MRINAAGNRRFSPVCASSQRGVSLIELVVFIVVVSIGLGAVLSVFSQSVVRSVDPVVRVKALEKAQSLMDEILARKFDENTPTGGVPACDSIQGTPCAGIVADAGYDDVGDYHGYSDTTDSAFHVSAEVIAAGEHLGLAASRARLIRITVAIPGAEEITLAAYKVNF